MRERERDRNRDIVTGKCLDFASLSLSLSLSIKRPLGGQPSSPHAYVPAGGRRFSSSSFVPCSPSTSVLNERINIKSVTQPLYTQKLDVESLSVPVGSSLSVTVDFQWCHFHNRKYQNLSRYTCKDKPLEYCPSISFIILCFKQ